MTPPLAATLNGAFACTLVLFGLIAAVLSVWDAWRGRRADRARDEELRRGFRAAKHYRLLPEDER